MLTHLLIATPKVEVCSRGFPIVGPTLTLEEAYEASQPKILVGSNYLVAMPSNCLIYCQVCVALTRVFNLSQLFVNCIVNTNICGARDVYRNLLLFYC